MSVKEIKLITPNFESNLIDVLMDLNHVRKMELGGTTFPKTFFQLKNIFHMLESIGSARIEGNRTTISEYVERKINNDNKSTEQFSEIANVEEAMSYIDDAIDKGSIITHHFIRELHHLTVNKLTHEGDKTPGAYREWNVEISKSEHKPPEHYLVQDNMDNLLAFINEECSSKYDLLKIAQAHHVFTWIHPFGNGNGRTVRLLTYALLIKYGFNVKTGGLLNPSAVFFNNRDKYYEMLTIADKGSDTDILEWTEYVLSGILEEIEKVNKLTDYNFLKEKILIPALNHSLDRGIINDKEFKVLQVAIEKQVLTAKDVSEANIGLTPRQITTVISSLKSSKTLIPVEDKSRVYYIDFTDTYLLRSIIIMLEKENFISEIN